MATNKYITNGDKLDPTDLRTNGSQIGGDVGAVMRQGISSGDSTANNQQVNNTNTPRGAASIAYANLTRRAPGLTDYIGDGPIRNPGGSNGGGREETPMHPTRANITNKETTSSSTGIANPTQEVTGATTADEELKAKLQSFIDNPTLPTAATQTATLMEPKDNEFVDGSAQNTPEAIEAGASQYKYKIAKDALTSVDAEMKAELAEAGAVSPTTAAKYEATKAAFNAATQVIQGTVSKTVDAIKGKLSEGAMAEAAIQDLDDIDPKALIEASTHEVPNGATVKGQLDGLLAGLENGDVPEWAKPAVAQAEAMLSSRGMSSSSVGRQALFNSIISSAMPIAQQDAQAKLSVFQQDISNEQQAKLANSTFFQNLTMQNLSNKQQTALTNAATIAQMDMADADRAQQAQISNAQLFLQMDLANMNNQQQAALLDSQQRQQTLLSNQSATNAAKQFNASSQQQADQFNSNLAASVDQFNVQQKNAMNQFNTEKQYNAQQFNSQLDFNREQFNVQNATAIEQSNVQWRRQTNQINTAATNAVNQANAMNAFNLSNQALTFLWQENRDKAKWAFEGSENEEERRVRMAIAALSNESMQDAQMAGNITDLARTAASLFDSWGD